MGRQEQRIGLVLQLITVPHLIEQGRLVLHLGALRRQLLLEPLSQLVLPLLHQPLAKAIAVISR